MSKFLRGLGTFIQIAGGLFGFVISLLFVYVEFGGSALAPALIFFPVAFTLVPWYSLLVYGAWNLLLINYGSIATGWFLHWIANKIDEQPQEHEKISAPEVSEPEKDNNPVLTLALLAGGGLLLVAVISFFSRPTSVLPPTLTSTPRATIAQPTKTAQPRSTSTPRLVSVHACVTNSTIRIRKGPGTDHEAISGLASGTCMTIQGRSSDSSWVYMVSEDGKTGWVAASLLTIDGNLSRVLVRSDSAAGLSAAQISALSTYAAEVDNTNTPEPLSAFDVMPLCSDAAAGERTTCQIPRAYCDYLPAVDGSPTFCNDRPYPDHNFAMVVWGVDWSELDGSCIIVSGSVKLFRGKPQIEVASPSQVSYCE
jgi:uncharacterized protein YraI